MNKTSETINTKLKLDFDQRARAVKLENHVTDDEYATAAEIIFLRDRVLILEKAIKFYADPQNYVRHDHYYSPSQDFPAWREPSNVMNDAGEIARVALGQPDTKDPHVNP